MFYIIEKSDQLQKLESLPKDDCFINIITWNDFYHPNLTRPSLIYYKNIKTNKGFILCNNHSESFGIDYNDILKFIFSHSNIYVLDKKFHLYFLDKLLVGKFKMIDVNFNRIEHNKHIINDSEYNTVSHNILYNKHEALENIDKIVPIAKHYEKWEKIYNEIKEDIYEPTREISWFNNVATDVFFNIEKNGIRIDSKQFFKHYDPHIKSLSIVNDRIFTYYNLYNTTTRPSNSFNGINFSALVKTTRNAFIAENDYLVEFDYREYHPRLIAKEIGYKVDKSIYEELSELFECTVDEAKKITFRQLYGGIESKYAEVEYFKKINDWIEQEWRAYNELGYIKLFGGKKAYVEDPNKSKIFNYIIQSLETYRNIQILTQIQAILKGKKTKLIHYTYDAFLFDVSMDDKIEFNEIKELISADFPIKISYGENYRDMQKSESF